MEILKKIRLCDVCSDLPIGIRPVVQLDESSKIIIIGQAPGRKVHETGIAWNDKSGETLRKWLNISKATFYDSNSVSIMAMGFCYRGKGTSGDLPPRPECAKLWHPQIINQFTEKPLIILIGQYAQKYYLQNKRKQNLTETVRNFEEYLPDYFVLPHPSPRNQNWVKINPWFSSIVLPRLQKEVHKRISSSQL